MVRTHFEHGTDSVQTIVEIAALFARPDHTNPRDTGPFRHFLEVARDPGFRPVLLVEPSGSDWWLIDGIHRAAALYAVRRASGTSDLRLPVFVLPRPLR